MLGGRLFVLFQIVAREQINLAAYSLWLPCVHWLLTIVRYPRRYVGRSVDGRNVIQT